MDEQDKKLSASEAFLMEEPPLEEELAGPMPELTLEAAPEVIPEEEVLREEAMEPVILCPEIPREENEMPVEPEPAEQCLQRWF